ncbi:MAG: hypothetical protein BWK80_37220 [Desulfobacteraceae bacterium IS3]|nr:MAG: hypothetical protein BWK80_37220 [Desulfobacteraceae bacterium IS3]
MKRFFFIGFIMLAAAIFADAAQSKTYKIAMSAGWLGTSPANVAEAKGFWKEQGIDVQVVVMPELVDTQKLLKNKLVDIDLDIIGSAVEMYMQGIPVVVIAETDWSYGGDQLILKKDADIRNLRGSAIGVYTTQVSLTYFLSLYFSKNSMKLSDFRLLEMELKPMADKFIAGILQGAVLYGPEVMRAVKEGNGRVVATTADFEGCMTSGIVMLKDTLDATPEDDLIRIFKGWIKAVKWIKDAQNFKEYVEIVNKSIFKGEAPYSEDTIKEMLQEVRIHDDKTMLERVRDGGGLHAHLKDINAFLKANNLLKKDFKPEDLSDNKAILEALKDSQ